MAALGVATQMPGRAGPASGPLDKDEGPGESARAFRSHVFFAPANIAANGLPSNADCARRIFPFLV